MSKGTVNKAILVGNLGADPEIRYTASGSAVASLRIATTRAWKDRNTNELQEETQWHRVVLFGKLAENLGSRLHKGAKIYIEGRLQTRTYEKEGQTHYSTEVVAESVECLSSLSRAPAEGAASTGRSERAPQPAMTAATDPFDEDIPF